MSSLDFKFYQPLNLQGDDYTTWATRFRIHAECLGCLKAIDMSATEMQEAEAKAEEGAPRAALVEQHRKATLVARKALSVALHSSLIAWLGQRLDSAIDKAHPSDTWRTIKDRFCVTNIFQSVRLRQQLADLHLTLADEKSIITHIDEFNKICSEIRISIAPPPEVELAIFFCMSLRNAAYEHLLNSYSDHVNNDVNKISLVDIQQRLLHFSRNHHATAQPTTMSAQTRSQTRPPTTQPANQQQPATSHSSAKRGGHSKDGKKWDGLGKDGNCWFCRSPGHGKFTCPVRAAQRDLTCELCSIKGHSRAYCHSRDRAAH